jgi:purine-binding chemotaxis protein CheW
MIEETITSVSSDRAAIREILRSRARQLACKPKARDDNGSAIEVIEFRLAKERYAIERKYVREVCPLRDLTPVPCTPAFVLGIVNVRGQLISVIDIKRFFELPETGITDLHAVVIIHADDIGVGILADAVVGAGSIPIGSIQASLPTLTGIRSQYLKGVTEQAVVVLDALRMLTDQKIIGNADCRNKNTF